LGLSPRWRARSECAQARGLVAQHGEKYDWLQASRRKAPLEAPHTALRCTTMAAMITDTILGLGTVALSLTAGAVLAVVLGLIPLAS
jgi:hypothetical protein